MASQHPIPLTFHWPLQFCFYTTVAVYLLSIITGNVSQVDRLWTFLPVIYTTYYALLPYWPQKLLFPLFPYAPEGMDRLLTSEPNPRALLMLFLQFIWMCRLTYNTWRRGLFNLKDEDYRWELLRQKMPRWFFQLFNIVFIAIIQNILLFMLAIPTHNAAVIPPSQRVLGTSDYVLAALSLITVAFEFVADNQQYSYQTFKRSGVLNKNEWPGARIDWTLEDVKRGFVTRGLWAWSRHPNFLCEQTFWILQSFIPILATGKFSPLAYDEITPLASIIPALALNILFFSSTIFTESISVSKYPDAYRAYQSRVSMFVPFLTPVWGYILKLRGKREYADKLVYGVSKGKKRE